MARRGLIAELQRQARLAEQRQRAAMRHQAAVARQAELAARARQREHASWARATEADRKRQEREAAAAHVEEQQEEAQFQNAELQQTYAEIDGLLSATLDVDDYVNLEMLRVRVEHPAFAHRELQQPVARPAIIADPPPPVRIEPAPATGFFGRKKKTAEAAAAAEQQYAADYFAWQNAVNALPARRAAQEEEYLRVERERVERLRIEMERYETECADRDARVRQQNTELDTFITALSYGTAEAVQEYVGMVLANSIYPDSFPVSHSFEFDPATAELDVKVTIPGPTEIPTIKSYRYVKASDEITATQLTQKDIKERYAAAVHNVTLRTLHEIFEADRRALIKSVSAEIGTDALNPATGRRSYVPLVAVAVARDTFLEFDLSAVTPASTLTHLNAAVSKNPVGLVAANRSGVRRA